MALIQKQEEENKKSYYVLRKRSAQGSYVPISYIDNEGHFRGAAVFDDLSTAVQYQKKYEEKLAQKYLKRK